MLKAFFSDNVALAEFYQHKIDEIEASDEASDEVSFCKSQLIVLTVILQQDEVESIQVEYLNYMVHSSLKMTGQKDCVEGCAY